MFPTQPVYAAYCESSFNVILDDNIIYAYLHVQIKHDPERITTEMAQSSMLDIETTV